MCPPTQFRNQAVPWSDGLPLAEEERPVDDWPEPDLPPDDTAAAEPAMPAMSAPLARRATAAELAALLQQVMRQDEAALSELYALMSGPVYTVALRFTRRVDLAEEVLQDTFWQIWRQAPRFDPARGTAAAWIMTIARSRAMDAARASQRATSRSARLDADGPAESCGELAPDPLDLLCDVRRDSRLHAALSALEPTPRQLVGLAFYRGFTHEEIASQTGLPLGTVKSHLRRTLAALRQALGADFGVETFGRSA